MSSAGNDRALLQAVFDRNFGAVKAAVEAGASVNGPPEAHCPPIAAAVMVNHFGMVECFLWQEVDPDKSVTIEWPISGSECFLAFPGERALHIAVTKWNFEIVRLILRQFRADPNATDHKGSTPLMSTCLRPDVSLEAVRLHLEAGANPCLPQQNGFNTLHAVALRGHMELVDMLYSRELAMLNNFDFNDMTPFYLACERGQEIMVSKLLSLGAMQPAPSGVFNNCPLIAAAHGGFVGVVRILMREGGIRAVGGEEVLPKALSFSISYRQPRILQLLLMADGQDRRSELAGINAEGKHLLHYAAGFCFLPAVGILLEAGADPAVLDSVGFLPRKVIRARQDEEVRLDLGKAVAIDRMLQRGPAYRARSWAWPSDGDADAWGSDGGETAAPTAVLSSPQAAKPPTGFGFRIFRPQDSIGSKVFGRILGGYCAKG